MRKARDISVELNYPKDEEDLKELEIIKAKIIINILKDEYGEIELDRFINSIREKVKYYKG